jgi:3-hydroxyisobutyrate dehydrogenase-like beta-hydroxyacid dehydrogenase
MATVAFIGLGVMGYPMAGYLKTKGGHDVRVYNRTTAKAEKWAAEFGGTACALPSEAATGADFVFTCVGNDDDLRAVTLGANGVLEGMKEGAILIDNTTASAEVARELAAACAAKGCGFLDAPVSGGQAGAENGVLTVMVGGDEAIFAKAQPGDRLLCPHGWPDGPGGQRPADQDDQPDLHRRPGSGPLRGHSFRQESRSRHREGGRSDLQGGRRFLADGKPPQDHECRRVRHGFAVDWMRKDLDIVLNEAKRNGATLPVTALVDQFYADVQAMGGNRWDTSALLARLEK